MSRRAANCRMGGAQRYPSMPARAAMGFASLYPSYENTLSRSRGADRPRFAFRLPSMRTEGAGKTECLLHPRSRVRFALNKSAHEHTGQLEHPGLPCAMALRLTSCSPRRTALLPPSPALLIASLAPAPRRPNHTTSPYASCAYVSRAFSVHRISPHVRDDRERPSIG